MGVLKYLIVERSALISGARQGDRCASESAGNIHVQVQVGLPLTNHIFSQRVIRVKGLPNVRRRNGRKKPKTKMKEDDAEEEG